MKIKVLALATASLLAIAPGTSGTAKPVYGTWGYDATAMDAAVKPGDDFFDYVNGAWAKRTPIAADRTFVGIDSVLNDQIDRPGDWTRQDAKPERERRQPPLVGEGHVR